MNRYGYRRGIAAAALGALAALAPGLALATNIDNILVSVTDQVDPLDVSMTGPERPSYGGYRFFLRNNTNGSLNRVRFRAYFDSTNDTAEFVLNNPIQGIADCQLSTPKVLDCLVGSNGTVPSQASTEFFFGVKAPTGGSELMLHWDVRFGSGASAGQITSNAYYDESRTASYGPVKTQLKGVTTGETTAFVPPAGMFIYTGISNNVPVAGDVVSFGADILPAKGYAIRAAIEELSTDLVRGTRLGVNFSVKTTDGVKAKLTDGLSQKLVIYLRLDASQVTGQDIRTAQLWYIPDTEPGTPPAAPYEMPACSSKTFVPPPGQPCIYKRTAYSLKDRTIELQGDWEFIIFASDNGRFEM